MLVVYILLSISHIASHGLSGPQPKRILTIERTTPENAIRYFSNTQTRDANFT